MQLPKLPRSYQSYLKATDRTRQKYYNLYASARDHLVSQILYLRNIENHYGRTFGYSSDQCMRAARLKWRCEAQLRQLNIDFYRYTHIVVFYDEAFGGDQIATS